MLPNQDSCWISWGNHGISEHDLMIKIPQDSSKAGKRKNSRSNKKMEKHIKPHRKLAPIRLINLSGKKEHVWDMSPTMSLNFPGQAKEHQRNSDFCCLIFGHEKQQVSGISWRTASIPNGQSTFLLLCWCSRVILSASPSQKVVTWPTQARVKLT